MKRILAFFLSLMLSGIIPAGIAFADDVYNTLDASIDVSLETMNLTAGGPTGSVTFSIVQQNGDGKNGCNFTGSNTLVVSVNTNAPGVATISPSTLTFGNCGDNRVATVTGVANGTATISLSVVSNGTSGSFNLAPASFSVIVAGDSVAPILTLPSNMTLEATSPSGRSVTFSATATDANPAHPTVTCAPASGATFPLGTTTVNCSATDASGNVGHGSFSITIVDTTAPVIAGTPSNITMEATGASGATVTYTNPTATDLVDGSVAVSCTPVSGSIFPLGDNSVNCTATDAHGNSAHSTFHIIITDTTAPILVLPGDLTAEATGPSGAVVTFSPTATDLVDGSVAVSCTPSSGSTFGLGETEVDCSATDAHGNTASGSFSVTVEDTTAPAIDVASDITEEATSPAGAAVTYANPSATDLVDGSVAVSCTPASGSTFALGTTNVECTATDNSGNSATTSFTVTVEDTTPPSIDTNSDLALEATSPAGAVGTFALPSATDLVDTNLDVSCAPASGSFFPLGHNNVTCTATDDSGNFATSFFDVFVADTQAPTVSCGSADGLWHATDISITCTASDSGSGLANSSDASFSLTTVVSAGTFDANAPTGTRSICDVAGNCATAGPITGNKIDKTAPIITITTPAIALYTFHQNIPAQYVCTDTGSGIATCTGTVASGSNINTATLGGKIFTVNASDIAGNTANKSVNYTVVGYTFGGFKQPVSLSAKEFKQNSTIPVKFQLFNTLGQPISNAVATLKVNGVNAVASGGSNTGNLFRYDVTDAQYIFNLSTKSLSLGTNTLLVTFDDGSTKTTTITIK